jgi:hypothetical protein
MEFPKLRNGQYAVFRGKITPSLVLGLGPQVDTTRGKWRIFNTLAAAHDYATTEVTAQPSVECGFYDATEHHIHTVRM